MTDAELESLLDQRYRAYLAAVQTGGDAIAAYKAFEALDRQRTPEQLARSFAIAELKPDYTCAHARTTNGICDKCGATVPNGSRA